MKENFLLKTKNAERLYNEYARDLPIIDFHNHVSVGELKSDKHYRDIVELWLEADPYKHRLMRIAGIPERYITGDAEPFEKFSRFAEIFPRLAGNPVYDWARMELAEIFGIDEPLCTDSAERIYERCNELLGGEEYTSRKILSRFNIEYQSPVASLLDGLEVFDAPGVAPSLRADDLIEPADSLIASLEAEVGISVKDADSYVAAVAVMLDRFAAGGCRIADHALDSDFFSGDDAKKREDMLVRLAAEYKKRGWTLLLHIDAKRRTSDRLRRLAGPAGGYAAAGGRFDLPALTDLIGRMEREGGLPDVIIFPLNMSDQAPLAILQGSFSEDGTSSKVSLGPAWWWCDHALGIENTLEAIASFGVLSEFVGMTTDSRSILSFVRHDYFRRIFCTFIDRLNDERDLEMSYETMGEIVQKVCYENARKKISKGK